MLPHLLEDMAPGLLGRELDTLIECGLQHYILVHLRMP